MTDTVDRSAGTDTTDRAALWTPDALRRHWEGHRGLTRRTIERFPEEALFGFTPAPPMRPFAAMVLEVIGMVGPVLDAIESGNWDWAPPAGGAGPATKAGLLAVWDATGAALRERWAALPEARLTAEEAWFGLPATPNLDKVLYLVDNEVHHRAQGFVYLRLLGIEPPAFFER